MGYTPRMTLKTCLILSVILMLLIILVQAFQYLMLRVFSWGFNVTETVATPLALLLSFVVGYFLATRSSEKD
jgi:accessory gene regulator protein AgrB